MTQLTQENGSSYSDDSWYLHRPMKQYGLKASCWCDTSRKNPPDDIHYISYVPTMPQIHESFCAMRYYDFWVSVPDGNLRTNLNHYDTGYSNSDCNRIHCHASVSNAHHHV